MAAAETQKMEAPVDVRTNAFKYFSRTNYANKSILLQEKILKKHMEDQWDSIPSNRQDDLLDLMSVNEEVREKYSDTDNRCNATATDQDVEESFPRLLINMGQKINVDFENELWTWRDEHSGPFSWMSRSQQDLTLCDLEADNILKPQPKQPRVDLEDEASQKKAEPQFTRPCNSWCLDILSDFHRQEAVIALTPSPSLDFNERAKAGNSVEELNPAFENSVDDDLSPRSSPEKEADCHESSPEGEEKSGKQKERGRKSPSPKKMGLHSNSFKKSPVKKSERGKDEKLIFKGGDEHLVSEAYCNPAMESEWSSFIGDQRNLPVTDAPEAQVMDRGGASEVSSVPSPYRGDLVRLIPEVDDSPAAPRSLLMPQVTPDPSEWSGESTPDHKTHLLKGLQSPQKPLLATLEDGLAAEPAEEMLSVVLEDSHIRVVAQDTEKRTSHIPSTGFDFLDNW